MKPYGLTGEEFLRAIHEKNSEILLAEKEYFIAYEDIQKKILEFLEKQKSIDIIKEMEKLREKKEKFDLIRSRTLL